MQQKGRNPYRFPDEDYLGEDVDEEGSSSCINLSKFERGNENKEVRYGDSFDNNLGNIFLRQKQF